MNNGYDMADVHRVHMHQLIKSMIYIAVNNVGS